MKGLSSVWAWIRLDWKRSLFEVVIALALTFATWHICQYVNGRANLVCQDEAEAMRQQWVVEQAGIDKIIYEGRLNEKEQEISKKDEEILSIKRKMASDSIKHLSDLAAVRAINQYVHGKK